MKQKHLIYLLVIVVVLVIVFLGVKKGTVPKAEVRWLAQVDSSKIDEITITRNGETYTIARGANGWNLTSPLEYPATSSFTKSLLGKLTELQIESEVTSKPDRWKEFEVDEEKGAVVKIKQGDKIDEVVIGKVASGYRQSYARKQGNDTVYLIRGSYASSLNRKIDNWREKKIGDVSEDDIIKVTTDKATLSKEAEGWRIKGKKGEGFLADEKKVKSYLGAISRIRTAEFPDSTEYAHINWDKPLHTMTVELSSGDSRLIKFYTDPTQKERYFFLYHDKPWVFRCYQAIMNQLIKDADEFKVEEKEGEPGGGMGEEPGGA